MTGWEYEDREYWEKVYALPENYMVEAAVTEGNDGEDEFDAKMLNTCVGKVVLDVGCGDGLFTIKMAERAIEVVGVDFSRVAISEARKNLSKSGQKNLRFELANAESLHFSERNLRPSYLQTWAHHRPQELLARSSES